MSAITELLYTSIKLSISLNNIRLCWIIDNYQIFEHQFIPKHKIEFACSRSDIEVAKRPKAGYMRDVTIMQ